MKKLYLLSTVAAAMVGQSGVGQAADMPVKAPVMPVVVPFSWTGFYLGANVGGAWGHRDVTDITRALAFTQTSNGRFIGGGQAGLFNALYSDSAKQQVSDDLRRQGE